MFLRFLIPVQSAEMKILNKNYFFILSNNWFGNVFLSKKNSAVFLHDYTHVFIKVPTFLVSLLPSINF
jgi:hypothetical protein